MRLLCFLAVVSWISAAPDFNYKFKGRPFITGYLVFVSDDKIMTMQLRKLYITISLSGYLIVTQ